MQGGRVHWSLAVGVNGTGLGLLGLSTVGMRWDWVHWDCGQCEWEVVKFIGIVNSGRGGSIGVQAVE